MSSMPVAELDLPEINQMLDSRTPPQIVQWAFAQFGSELIMTSSFGAESAVLLHMASQFVPRIRVVMVDTGYLFPETHAFMEQLRLRFDLNVWVYKTKNDPIRYLSEAGETDPTWRNNVDQCCGANKNEPFDRAMAELKPQAWLRGVRGNQTQDRKSMKFVEWSERYNCYAVSPLLNWSTKDIYQYMKQNDLPYHPLYEQGYLSIGCNPASCTRAVQAGEDPRAGRWAGKNKVECGLHLGSLDSSQL